MLRRRTAAIAVSLALVAGSAAASVGDPFPEIRPTNRSEAVRTLTDRSSATSACLTQRVVSVRRAGGAAPLTERIAVSILERRAGFRDEVVIDLDEGLRLRYAPPVALDGTSVEPGRPPSRSRRRPVAA